MEVLEETVQFEITPVQHSALLAVRNHEGAGLSEVNASVECASSARCCRPEQKRDVGVGLRLRHPGSVQHSVQRRPDTPVLPENHIRT